MLGPSALAAALGISRQMVYQYRSEGKITPDASGQYDLDTVRQQLARNLGAKKGGVPRRGERGTVEVPQRKQPVREAPRESARVQPGRFDAVSKADLEKAALAEKIRKEKRANDLADGKIINAEEAAIAWAEAGVKWRDAFLGLPAAVCNRLPAEWRREVSAAIEDESRRRLAALSDEIRCSPTAA
ncbi:MAG: hypothetical protein LLG20_03895, partial [Acidobacteriales bacterium]|nr:hypothetical protein [Terriglobales bacterium]